MIVYCVLCNDSFITKRQYSNHKYCDSCISRKCKECENVFKIKPKANKKQIFCSRNCYSKSMTGVTQLASVVEKRAMANRGRKTGEYKTCFKCKLDFYKMPSRIKKTKGRNFCSMECFKEWSKTSDNPEWRGDSYPKNKRLRQSRKYKEWRKEILKRDNYKCVLCGYQSRGTKPADVHVDHIKSWSLFPKERFNIENGRTLCVDCHKKTPSWGVNAKFYPTKVL